MSDSISDDALSAGLLIVGILLGYFVCKNEDKVRDLGKSTMKDLKTLTDSFGK